MEIHQSFSQLGAMGILSFVATAVGAKGGFSFSTTHARLGIPICAVLIIQIVLGWIVRTLLPRSHNWNLISNTKRLHAWIGISLWICAVINCYLGLRFFVEPSHPIAISFVIYIVGSVSLYSGLAVKRFVENRRRDGDHLDAGTNASGKGMKANMTYADFVERVEHGQQLVLIGGNVYNVRDFVRKHPGGAQVLIDNIGTDCTSVFDSVHKHSVAAITLMNKRMLEGRCSNSLQVNRYGIKNSEMLCLCGVSICSEHFKRFKLVAKQHIGGDAETPIVLFRLEIENLFRTSGRNGIKPEKQYEKYLAEGGTPPALKRSLSVFNIGRMLSKTRASKIVPGGKKQLHTARESQSLDMGVMSVLSTLSHMSEIDDTDAGTSPKSHASSPRRPNDKRTIIDEIHETNHSARTFDAPAADSSNEDNDEELANALGNTSSQTQLVPLHKTKEKSQVHIALPAEPEKMKRAKRSKFNLNNQPTN
jgi:cytochrome b involved in lipid metabolism